MFVDRAVGSLVVALLCGCGPRTAEIADLEVTQFRHAGARGVLINESLVVHFSAVLDPRSVTSRTVRLLDERGRPVSGEVTTTGRRLSFEPDLPLDAALETGSLRPGATYTLELLGFPRVDALRSREGGTLARTYRSQFTTVDAQDERPFLDEAPDRPAMLAIERAAVEAGAPWVLLCDKPIDPRSVEGDVFLLVSRIDMSRFDVRCRLVTNNPDGARLELMPLDSRGLPCLLPIGEYALVDAERRHGLRDLNSTLVRLPWRALPLGASLFVEAPEPPPIGPRFVESFDTRSLASPRIVPESVGQARWEGDGRVRLSVPRSAGDGRDGRVTTLAEEGRRRWQATSVHVPEGDRSQLPSEGLVVIAAQGTLEIAGRVTRRVQPDFAQRRSDEAAHEWLRRLERSQDFGVGWIEFELGETLSEFLARAERDHRPWTCFIAGGDIVVSGEVDCDGPVLFVSGGRVRVPGSAVASEAWFTQPYGRSSVVAWIDTLPIEVDQPEFNVLVEDQTWSIVSGPIRPGSGFRRWSASRVAGNGAAANGGSPLRPSPPGGRFDVLYIGSRPGPDGRSQDVGPVADVRLLEDCPTVRLRIDLTVFASKGESEPWSPPWVDEVELIWE